MRYVLVAASAFFWACRAEAVTVALLRPSPSAATLDEALFRLQGELLALGASVTILDAPRVVETNVASEELRAELERTARERGVDAFIAVVGNDTRLEADVWIRDKSSGSLRSSRVTLEPTVEDRTATLAIRAIEVLRSSFLALDLAARERPVEPRSSPVPVRKSESPADAIHPRLGLEAGATAMTSFSNVGPAVIPLLHAGWAFDSWLSLQATGAAFGTRPRVESAGGDVDVAREFVLLGLGFGRMGPGIRPFLELSTGALHTGLDASPSSPNVGHHAERWAALADAGVGARLGFAGPLYLSVAAHVQLAEPYVAIHVLDSVVATTGRPNLLLTLTAGVCP